MQWSWGLDSSHDRGSEPADLSMQQATVNLTCSPPVRKEQRASLLLSNREIQAETFAVQTADLQFVVKDAEPGEYPLRLRVDGVDSLLIKDYEAAEMAFDTVKKVIIA